MLKNKDGSYNKVSLLLLSLITIIVIGLALSKITEVSTIDIIIIIGLFGMICFGIYLRQIFKKISSISLVQLLILPLKPKQELKLQKDVIKPDLIKPKTDSLPFILPLKPKQELKLQKDVIKPDLIKPKTDSLSCILSLIMASVFIIITLVVVQTVILLPSIPNPEFAALQASVLDAVNNGFGFIVIGLFIGVAIFIIKLVGDLIGN